MNYPQALMSRSRKTTLGEHLTSACLESINSGDHVVCANHGKRDTINIAVLLPLSFLSFLGTLCPYRGDSAAFQLNMLWHDVILVEA